MEIEAADSRYTPGTRPVHGIYGANSMFTQSTELRVEGRSYDEDVASH